jgi:hypothetical protein
LSRHLEWFDGKTGRLVPKFPNDNGFVNFGEEASDSLFRLGIGNVSWIIV